MAGQRVQPSTAMWGRSHGRFSSGPSPMMELEHEDDWFRVDGAQGRLQRCGDGGARVAA
jgi:hypothetical protein